MKFPNSYDYADRSCDAAVDALLFPAMSQQMHAMNNFTGESRSKVARQDFVWTRLKMAGTNTHQPLVIQEKPNLKILSMMLDMDADRIGNRDAYEKMQHYESVMIGRNGIRNVHFDQKDFTDYAKSLEDASGIKYEGQVKIGRAYTSSPLIYFPKAVINTLYKQTHLELDIKASYPTMLWNAFGGDGDMPYLEKLAINSDELYGDIYDQYGIERGDIKTACMAMIGAFPSGSHSYGLGDDEIDKARTIGELPFITGFLDDLNTLAVKMNEKYAGFMGTMAHYADATGKLDHVGGVAMCLFAGDMEHECMRVIIKELAGNKPDNIVWKFDGVLVPQDLINDDKVASLERKVLDKTGIQIKLGVKSLHLPSFGISLSPSEANEDSAYLAFKRKHEKTFFCCKNPPGPVMIRPDGTYQLLAMKDYNFLTAPLQKEFNQRWITDEHRRTYDRIDYLPPPLVCPPSVYNSYHGMAAESLDDVDPGYDIEPYKKHVWLLMGAVDTQAEYMHKLIAFKIQNPASKWRVFPFIRSTPGVGKDVWFDFLADIVGKENTVKTVKLQDIMGNQTHRMANKLLGCITELDFKDGSTYAEELKDQITSNQMNVKQKYHNDFDATSTICLMGFSNNFEALKFKSDDRRFFVVTADGRHANDPVYFEPLIEWMGKTDSQRAVYDFYKSMDITGFDPSAERPVTEAFKEMASSSTSLCEIVIRDNFEQWVRDATILCHPESITFHCKIPNIESHLKIHNGFFLDCFTEKAKDFQYAGAESRAKTAQLLGRQMGQTTSMVRRFSKMDADVITNYRSNGRTYRLFEIEAIRSWIESIKTENDSSEEEIDQPAMLIAPQR